MLPSSPCFTVERVPHVALWMKGKTSNFSLIWPGHILPHFCRVPLQIGALDEFIFSCYFSIKVRFVECTGNICSVNRVVNFISGNLRLIQSYKGPLDYFSDYCSFHHVSLVDCHVLAVLLCGLILTMLFVHNYSLAKNTRIYLETFFKIGWLL